MAEKNNSRRGLILIVGLLLVASLIVGLWFGLRRVLIGRPPTQPVAGYAGDWKMRSVHGEAERPLPPAAEIWQVQENWRPPNDRTFKYYLARLGHAERQINFQASTNQPRSLGDREFTYVTFLYRDPTNGDYALSWQLNGKHDVNFLKFDGSERWVQLELVGDPGTQPPRLWILGIEGFAPFYN